MRLSTLLLLLTILLASCQDDTLQVPTKDAFTKEKQEALGKLISNQLFINYEFLPDAAPYDSLYWYTQTLYNQATSLMRLDKQSPVDNRWRQDGEWKIFIINDNSLKHAFAMPGGDLLISTGMLKSFEREHELYYVLTFEASIMHEGILLERLIEEYNSLTINNLIEGKPTGNNITLNDVANALPDLVFDENAVEDCDKESVKSICNTSLLEPTGINLVLLDPNFQDAKWLETRPSYGSRVANITGLKHHDCGGVTGIENYERFVLNVLN